MSRWSSVGTAMVTASTCPSSSRASQQRRGVPLAAATSSARGPVGVDDRDQLHARQRRQNPRVMLAEMPDADDGDAQRHTLHDHENHEDTKKHEES